MRILVVHNYYQQPGGEDEVVRTEVALLRSSGVDVDTYVRHNDELKDRTTLLTLPFETIWSRRTRTDLRQTLRRLRPDVVHFHNTFPLISPSAYYGCKEYGVPVVQTLHNYRLICPAATLMRDGRPCQDCVGNSVPYHSVLHRCYRSSAVATTSVAAMLTIHNAIGTYTHAIDRYIALSEFSKQRFIEGGIPRDRIHVKPNCIYPTPAFRRDHPISRDYLLYIGRFSTEKGAETFAKCLRLLPSNIRIRVVGDGPLRDVVKRDVAGLANVSVESWVPRAEVTNILAGARLVVCPSECFENFPMTALEAFAVGTPVLCSRIGVYEELIQDGETGVHFTPGDEKDLAAKIGSLWDDEAALLRLARNARNQFDKLYTAERNRDQLMSIYTEALGGATVHESMIAS